MTELESRKLRGDAILLERAARVLDRTSRGCVLEAYSAGHWLGVKETLREVAQALRLEAENRAG